MFKFYQEVVQILTEGPLTSNVRVSNDNTKYPIGKSNQKIDTGGLKFLHTLFDTYLDYMLGKFEANRTLQNVQNVELFGQKNLAFKAHFWQMCKN